nr:hypothetical protein [uncultured Roseateles sp.]
MKIKLSLLVCALLLGCSSSQVLHAPVEVTVGQQLLDLKAAQQKGALSESEYQQQKRKLIEAAK